MMNKVQALHSFWSSFGLTAYDESAVPSKEALPYITYETRTDSFGTEVYMTASLWYRSTSWVDITNKAEEIAKAISRGGFIIPYDEGSIWIKRANPFAQRLSDEDDSIRRIVLNVSAEYLSAD